MKVKGKEFLQKFAEQNLFISRDGKQLTEKVRFYGEDVITEWREPGGEFARKILK
jgi:hypothetical protein